MKTVKVELEFPKEFVDAVKKLVDARGWWCRGLTEFMEEAVRLHYQNERVEDLMNLWKGDPHR